MGLAAGTNHTDSQSSVHHCRNAHSTSFGGAYTQSSHVRVYPLSYLQNTDKQYAVNKDKNQFPSAGARIGSHRFHRFKICREAGKRFEKGTKKKYVYRKQQ